MWHKNIADRFLGLVTKHACDRRTDGQNYDSQVRASIAASRGKNAGQQLGGSSRTPVGEITGCGRSGLANPSPIIPPTDLPSDASDATAYDKYTF